MEELRLLRGGVSLPTAASNPPAHYIPLSARAAREAKEAAEDKAKAKAKARADAAAQKEAERIRQAEHQRELEMQRLRAAAAASNLFMPLRKEAPVPVRTSLAPSRAPTGQYERAVPRLTPSATVYTVKPASRVVQQEEAQDEAVPPPATATAATPPVARRPAAKKKGGSSVQQRLMKKLKMR